MSDDLFYGRPISKGRSSISFEFCEVCQRKTPVWLESKFENNVVIVRFTCDDCHEKEFESAKINDEAFYARSISEQEELPDATRPAWMDEFIEEQKQSGAIEEIGDIENSTQEIKPFSKPDEQTQSSIDQEFIQEQQEEPEEIIQLAPWSAGFIQESLFGPNPEEWLENQGGYETNVLPLTISTLSSFSNNQINGVKLSSILCLAGIIRRNSSFKDTVIEALQQFLNDEDESVNQFAQQTLDGLR